MLDHNLSEHLVPLLPGCEIWTAKQLLWDQLLNGSLLHAAEAAGFMAMLTADQSIWYQQNNSKRRIALVVVNTNDLSLLSFHGLAIATALLRAVPGGYEFLELVPRRPKRMAPR